MKKLLLLSVLLFSTSAFAADYVCPATVVCERDSLNCTGFTSLEFENWQRTASALAGIYTFAAAQDTLDNPIVKCMYVDNKSGGAEFDILTNNKLIADVKNPESNWSTAGMHNYFCAGSTSDACPFIRSTGK